MKDKNDMMVFVQARLGSTRIPEKMIKPFADTTLLDILLEKLSDSTVIDSNNIWVSVHEPELNDIASGYDLNIFRRSEASANENEDATIIHEWLDYLDYKYMIMVSACNPLLKQETIERFYQDFIESDRDGMFGVFEKKQYFWDKDFNMVQNYNPNDKFFNTKKVEPMYEAGHSLYGSLVDFLRDGYFMDNKFPPDIDLFLMDELETFDIDYPWQFEVGQVLYEQMKRGVVNV